MSFCFVFFAIKGVTGLGDLVFLCDHRWVPPFTTTCNSLKVCIRNKKRKEKEELARRYNLPF